MSIRALGLRGQDAWRRHPIFKWTWLDALPGIREGTGAFVALVIVEKTYAWLRPEEAHGAGEHGHAADASGHDEHHDSPPHGKAVSAHH